MLRLWHLASFSFASALLVPISESAAQGSESAYTAMRPGDALQVKIWQEPDLSGEFTVTDAGTVTLPLLGRVVVVDKPFERLETELMERYTAELRNPSIVLTPLRRINILGEVAKPGLYGLDPTVTLAGAIAMAEGTTPMGDLNRIRIVRGGQVIRERVGVAETLTGAEILSGDQIFVERRSWFDRNSTFLVSAMLSVTSIVTTIILNTR